MDVSIGLNHIKVALNRGLFQMINDLQLATAMTQWKQSAKQCWASYKRPSERLITYDFATDELETGQLLLTISDFHVAPETASAAYPIFFYARDCIVDFYLLPFLFANLQDYMRSGLSDRVADYIGKGTQQGLMKRFGIRGLCLIRDYFDLIGKMRGRVLESEQRAQDLICGALELGSPKKVRWVESTLYK